MTCPGFYERRTLPRLLDLATLEVGIGSGLNLPFYGERVERLVGVDPSEALLRMAHKRSRGTAIPVELLPHSGEALPLGDASVDTVVLTFTLCTIADPGRALREARRVLKPSGELLFAEHGLAPDKGVRRWHRRLNPLWRRVAGGCNLDRKVDELVRGAGFRLASLEAGYAKGPRPMSYVYLHRARPA